MQTFTTAENTAVYPKRWLILISFCTVTFLAMFASKSFSVANEIYAEYFNTSLAVLDWFTFAVYVGATVTTPIFAWLFFKQTAGFRKLSITAACCLLVSYAVILLSIHFTNLYPLLIISNFLQGVAYTVGYTVGPSFAVLWFPDDQVGIAIASDLLSQNLGVGLGAIIPTLVLDNVPSQNSSFLTLENTIIQNEMWKSATHNKLLFLYSPCICILLVLLIFFVLFVTDLPAKPPTHALWVKRVMDLKTTDRNFSDYLAALKSLYTDINFLLCSIILGISFNMIVVFYLHITAIVQCFDVSSIGIYLPNDIIGGIILGIYSSSNIVFGFVSAKISNKWKNYAAQTLAGLVFTFLVLVSMTLSFYYRRFYLFCVGVLFYSIGSRMFVIPLFEVLTRHTYPMDETFVSVWIGANGSFILIVIGEIARVVSLHSPPIFLLILMCTCAFASLVLTLMIDPKDKRRQVDLAHEKQKEAHFREATPLLVQK